MNDVSRWIELGGTTDAWAVIEAVARQADPLQAARDFVALMRHAYWKRKDLAAALRFGQAGAAFAVTAAATLATADRQRANELRGVAKGLLYDVASFAWPGWDEPGIAITPADVAAGRPAAEANLRLARELNRGDLPLSRAQWMLGGYHLCAADYDAAEATYRRAAEHARLAGSRADELLCVAFAHLSDVLRRRIALADCAELRPVREELAGLKDGPMFDGQIEAAYRVFSASPSIAKA